MTERVKATHVTRRYPLEPLFQAMRMTPAAACRVLNVSGSSMQGYRERGVSELVADRLATKAGCHPYTIWPEMLDHAIEDVEAVDKAAQEAKRKRDAARARRKWAEDDEYRQRRRAQDQAYKEATREAQRAYARKYREANRERLAEQRRANYQADRERILAAQKVRDRRRAEQRREEQERRAA